jgi:c-di-GMP-binding flagellar brake protein YcgR
MGITAFFIYAGGFCQRRGPGLLFFFEVEAILPPLHEDKEEMGGMTRDRRKNPRIDLHFKIIRIGKKDEGPYRVKDLSTGGLFIETEKPSKFREGQEIELVMREPADNRFMRLQVRVAHIDKEGIGVEFVNLTEGDQEILKTCFELFRHTLPKVES